MKKFGRLPRIFDPTIPHLSAMMAKKRLLSPIPNALDYSSPLPANLGMMKNNTLSNCTCAGAYHAEQVWTRYAGGVEITEPDNLVIQMYEEACGYNPQNPQTDQGGIEQNVLSYWHNTGIPFTGNQRHKLKAWFEVDIRNIQDVHRMIYDCGIVYIGFNVPSWLEEEEPPPVWDRRTGDTNVVGGHCVVLTGYDIQQKQLKLISWGEKYSMTDDFFQQFADEAYALISSDWIENTGKTPLEMTIEELEATVTAASPSNLPREV